MNEAFSIFFAAAWILPLIVGIGYIAAGFRLYQHRKAIRSPAMPLDVSAFGQAIFIGDKDQISPMNVSRFTIQQGNSPWINQVMQHMEPVPDDGNQASKIAGVDKNVAGQAIAKVIQLGRAA